MYTNDTPDCFIFFPTIKLCWYWIIIDIIIIKNLNINTFELFVLNTEFSHHNLHKNFMI